MFKFTHFTLALLLALATAGVSVAGDEKESKSEKAGEATEGALNTAGKGAESGLKTAGKGTKKGLEAAGDGVGTAVEETGEAGVKAGKATGNALKTAGNAVSDFFGGNGGDAKSQMKMTTKAQKRLKKHGYYTGPMDGVAGPQTVSSLKEFQMDNGIEPSGQLDPMTSKKLGL